MSFKYNIPVLCGYTFFFLILFSQFPLAGTLPGNCDTLLGIALSNTYLNELKAFVFDLPLGRGMYPAADIHPYGETALIPAALFIFWKLLGLNDIIAHYLYITILFSLTSLGVYLLVKLLTGNTLAALFAGFAFGCSNFMFANIDDSIILFYFLPALSLYFFFRYIYEKKSTYFYLAGIAGGLQAYCSLYVFSYQSIALAVALLFYGKVLLHDGGHKVFFKGVLLYFLISAPYFLYYIHGMKSLSIAGFNPAGNELVFFKLFALDTEHIFSRLPLNTIYSSPELPTGDFHFFIELRTRAFIGFLAPSLAILSLLKPTKEKLFFVVIGFIGLFLSWGEISIGRHVIQPPSYYLYKLIPLIEYLRVVFRAYFLVLLSVAVLSGYGLSMLFALFHLRSTLLPILLFMLFMVFHGLENTALPLPAFAATPFASAAEPYLRFFADKKLSTIVDLPSNSKFLQFVDMDKDINPYNREFIYLNWQTQHRQNTVNGLNGYYPEARLDIQNAIESFPEKNALNEAADFGIDYLVFHKNLTLHGEENLLQELTDSPDLKILMQTEETAIFKIALGPGTK